MLFLASYFFPGDESYHLGDWYTRVEGGTQQCWTYPYLPGERYLDKEVYVLTARHTFSAPEGLAAFLQHHEKALVVGRATILARRVPSSAVVPSSRAQSSAG